MAVLKCKMCGGDLNITADEKIVECEFCGTTQTVPDGRDEKKTNLFNRANKLRSVSEFDKASGIYESIIAEFPDEAEAYWGLCLCKFGIEYIDDPKTAKKIPTCHRTSFDSIFNDENYKSAIEKADVIAQGVYKEEATVIDNLQKDILSIVHKEEPFDIFICYKETDDAGARTPDSVLAQDIYTALTDKGFKVFFSRITLEDKLGKQYEPYIFAALNSAKVMLAIGTKEEYYNAVWVKNEWSRYLALMEKDKEKMLIPCYRDIDPYDMPQEFKNLQGQDMAKLGFLQDLMRGIEKIIPRETETVSDTASVAVSEPAVNPAIEPLLKRMFMFLEDGNWQSADDYAEKVLDIDPEYAEAYLGKLMAEYKVKWKSGFRSVTQPFYKNINYQKILRFGSEELICELDEYIVFDATGLLKITDDGLLEGFKYGESASKLVIPDRVLKIKDFAFSRCESLRSVVISGNVTSIGKSAFSGCSNLSSVTISESVTSIGDSAFFSCNNLASITIPEGVTSVGEYAFNSCSNLSSVTIPESVSKIEKAAFRNCGNLEELSVSPKNKHFYYKDGCLINSKNKELIFIKKDATMPDDGSVEKIGASAYADLPLTSITIPEGITSIGDSAFSGCNDLVSITIPGSVTSIGDSAFFSCNNLASITIPEGVTSIGDSAFSNCSNLASVIIPEGVTSIGKMAFCYCSKLSSITIPGSVTSIGEMAFYNCSSLASVIISEGVTSIGNSMFSDCNSLISIIIPGSVTSIREMAFYNCSSLASVIISEGVTSIGIGAFSSCKNLKSVTLPESVTNIESMFCDECTIISSVGSYAQTYAEKCKLKFKEDPAAAKKRAEEEKKRAEEKAKQEEQERLIIETRKKELAPKLDKALRRSYQKNIARSSTHIVGLKPNGTVVALGDNFAGECNVSGWRDIVAVFANTNFTAGLKSDGTVVVAGNSSSEKCHVTGWRNIVTIAAGGNHTVGLKSDGTVVATGFNTDGQCDVSGWRDIVSIAATYDFTLGLKSDGTVISTINDPSSLDVEYDFSPWNNIVAISVGLDQAVGLKADGTVVATGNNEDGQCNVSDWRDIVAITAGVSETLGLKADGTVISTELDNDEVRAWRNVVEIDTNIDTVALKADGTILCTDDKEENVSNAAFWTGISTPIITETKVEFEEVKRQKARRAAGVCQHCGGAFKGLFSKACAKCGKKKDY